jgi:hypothetical protein
VIANIFLCVVANIVANSNALSQLNDIFRDLVRLDVTYKKNSAPLIGALFSAIIRLYRGGDGNSYGSIVTRSWGMPPLTEILANNRSPSTTETGLLTETCVMVTSLELLEE